MNPMKSWVVFSDDCDSIPFAWATEGLSCQEEGSSLQLLVFILFWKIYQPCRYVHNGVKKSLKLYVAMSNTHVWKVIDLSHNYSVAAFRMQSVIDNFLKGSKATLNLSRGPFPLKASMNPVSQFLVFVCGCHHHSLRNFIDLATCFWQETDPHVNINVCQSVCVSLLLFVRLCVCMSCVSCVSLCLCCAKNQRSSSHEVTVVGTL